MPEGEDDTRRSRDRDCGDAPNPEFGIMPAVMALVTRDGRARPEVVGPHPHPLLVPCSAAAAKRGKRARLCGCPPCRAAFDDEP